MPYTDYMKSDTETYNWVIQAYTRVESYASLCVIGLTPSHIAFKDEGGITAVDFNVGKSDCSGIKVIGKRKKGSNLFMGYTGDSRAMMGSKDGGYSVDC
ncbi:hypothetical protein JHK87_033852 [Glycine soja]|nr:hypothetical protein JHK87_033852 [Glycine soja]